MSQEIEMSQELIEPLIRSDPSNHSDESESEASSNHSDEFMSASSNHSDESESKATLNPMSLEIQSVPSSNHSDEYESLAFYRRPLTHLPDDREKYFELGLPLYQASIKCDWKTAKFILDRKRAFLSNCYIDKPDLLRCSITENGETALHIAASAIAPKKKVDEFVRNLVEIMEPEDLELVNNNHSTALYLAAAAGNIEPVKIMMEKNPTLDTIPGGGRERLMPLYAAVLFGNEDVARYLYGRSKSLANDGWTRERRSLLLEKCVESDMFDIAKKILVVYNHTMLERSTNLLGLLARKPEAFYEKSARKGDALRLLRILWGDIVKLPKNDREMRAETMNRNTHSSWVMFIAAEVGNTNFLVELIRVQPDLIWQVDDNGLSIFHIAVKHRHECIYSLLYEIGSMKDMVTPLTDNDGNNMLHLAAMRTRNKNLEDVAGAALQMQRELLWFKEVERMIPPSLRVRKNKDGFTPRELFTMEHQYLIEPGEKWMKETASQCMVVAALIATIVFAAAFTVPGGYNQNDGIPMFNRKLSFAVFVVADAMSFFLSSASILTFLSFFTSRYAERDFIESLPLKLMLGLTTLITSIETMMVTFSVSFFVLYHKEMKWIPIFISGFAVIPVILYVMLQSHLLVDVFRSTYGGKYLFKPETQVLFYENPKV